MNIIKYDTTDGDQPYTIAIKIGFQDDQLMESLVAILLSLINAMLFLLILDGMCKRVIFYINETQSRRVSLP